MLSEELPFDVIIADESLCSLIEGYKSTMTDERLLGLANDYEDSRWRVELFCDKIMDFLPLCALSPEERSKCQLSAHSSIKRAVANLRRYSEGKGRPTGEIGEILLYGIMQYYFHSCESVPKIFYKQNSNDFVKGADSVHIVADENDFSFWLGEAKCYEDLNDAIRKAVNSVKEMLDRQKLGKEKSCILGLSKLKDNKELKMHYVKIESLLSNSRSIDDFRKKLHVPVLLVCEESIVGNATELSAELKQNLAEKYTQDARKFFLKLKESFTDVMHLCNGVKFHLILFPVPNMKELNRKFSDNISRYSS